MFQDFFLLLINLPLVSHNHMLRVNFWKMRSENLTMKIKYDNFDRHNHQVEHLENKNSKFVFDHFDKTNSAIEKTLRLETLSCVRSEMQPVIQPSIQSPSFQITDAIHYQIDRIVFMPIVIQLKRKLIKKMQINKKYSIELINEIPQLIFRQLMRKTIQN